MNHIKDYWVENEVFYASNLNEIAMAINALIDKVEISIIDDETPSTQKAYSSSKIEALLQAPTVDEVIDVLNEPKPYDDGYKHGSTDSYSGETQNPHPYGTFSYTEWDNGYEDGWEVNQYRACNRGEEAALNDLVSGATQNPYRQETEADAYEIWNDCYQSGWSEHLAIVYNDGNEAGSIDETSGATSNPYNTGTELNTEWARGYASTWAPRYQRAYDEGYEAGYADAASGDTRNPYGVGSELNLRWSDSYKQGWEDAHPEPQEEMHYWFVYSGDAKTNGVVIDGDMFTSMVTGTSSMNSSFVVDGITYTTTKRSSDVATFGNIVIPSGKTATVYIAAVPSGSAARTVLLENGTTGYSGKLNIDGGSSSLKVAALTGVPGGLTYKLSREGSGNVRISAIIVKLQ